MKKVLSMVLFSTLISVQSFAEYTYRIEAGDKNFTDISDECGGQMRVKAAYNKGSGELELRVCGVGEGQVNLCRWPILMNTNARFEPKAGTVEFLGLNSGRKLNDECVAFSLEYRIQANQKNIRATFGRDSLFQNKANIEIKFRD